MIEVRSLRFRLLAAWISFLLVTLPLAAFGIQLIFDRSISRGVLSDLASDLQLIAESLDVDDKGVAKLIDAPADPKYLRAHGGRYWQVSADGAPVLRSPSLWNETLKPNFQAASGGLPVSGHFAGPSDQALVGLVQRVQSHAERSREFEIATAVDYAEILTAEKKFSNDIWLSLAGFAILFLLAASAQVFIGLKPLHALSSSLLAVRTGDSSRIDGAFPTEIKPLIDETNALLKARDDALETARARAGNLAHGLKTPLAIMAVQSRQLRREGEKELSEELDKQIETMRCHVERELALSRARSPIESQRTRIDAAVEIRDIVNALKKLPKSDELDWSVAVKPPITLSVDRADFCDIIGNVLDNAQKWARHRISIEGSKTPNAFLFTVDDDGPGVQDEQFDRILQRGERDDPSVPGSGLGLAIVSDLVSLYGGRIVLSRSALGGLRAAITLSAV